MRARRHRRPVAAGLGRQRLTARTDARCSTRCSPGPTPRRPTTPAFRAIRAAPARVRRGAAASCRARPGRGDGAHLPQRARPGRRLRQERRRHRRPGRARLRPRRDRHRHRRAAAGQPDSRGCSGCPPTAPWSTGWASTTTAPRWSPGGWRSARPRPRADSTAVPSGARRQHRQDQGGARGRQAVARLREVSARLLAPYADYLVVNVSSPEHPRAARPPGRREARAAAGAPSARPPTTSPTGRGAAAGQDRPRPRRRRRARRRRPRRSRSASTGSSPPTPRSAATAWPPTGRQVEAIGAGGLSGTPADRALARGAAAAQGPGRRPTSPWSASAASPPSRTPAPGSTPAPPWSRATPRSSTRARCGRAGSLRGLAASGTAS